MQFLRQVSRVRYYSKGTKKLLVSFEERNEALKKLQRHTQYPLLTTRRPDLPVTRIKTLKTNYESLQHEPLPSTSEFELRGRITGIRIAGRGLMFLDVQEGGSQMQVVMNSKKLAVDLSPEENEIHSLFRVGDSISAVGKPWRTKAGELSLLCTMGIKLLSPSLHPLPDSSASDTIRKHNRVAELKAFPETREVLHARDFIIQTLASYLRSHDFTSVQTPHVSAQKGGATARLFETELEDGTPLYLRVAPELWLKRLIIGGFDRVFEIGNCYRNEGIDATHNPEFTTCEFYMSFATLDDLIALTKDILIHISREFAKAFPQFADNCSIFDGEWKVISFVDELERKIQRPLSLEQSDLVQICKDYGIEYQASDDSAHLLDRLAGHLLEPQCEGPTFIINHPSVMSPLAKESTTGRIATSRRFELFIKHREYVNAYEEENDPQVQLEKLRKQNPNVPDKSFVDALEWGLPPTGGWGIGIDRLVMLLTGSNRISDVLTFGTLNQVRRQ